MKLKIFQKGFNYSQDGAGNRLVYHLQGCNMKCPWCANPEGISLNGTLIVNKEWLIDSVCPHGAIVNKKLNRGICTDCDKKECININKNKGICLSCREYDIDTIADEIKRSALLFYDGGGITLTGGEPTLQFECIEALFKILKKEHINTAIETNGSHPYLENLFPLIDNLIMDFKQFDNKKHKMVTGIENSIIKDNISKAFKLHKNVLIRIPVIRHINDSEEDVRNFSRFFIEHDTHNAAFEFLPYHEYGKAKWIQCGLDYKMKDGYVDKETIKVYKKIFSENNLKVIHT